MWKGSLREAEAAQQNEKENGGWEKEIGKVRLYEGK